MKGILGDHDLQDSRPAGTARLVGHMVSVWVFLCWLISGRKSLEAAVVRKGEEFFDTRLEATWTGPLRAAPSILHSFMISKSLTDRQPLLSHTESFWVSFPKKIGTTCLCQNLFGSSAQRARARAHLWQPHLTSFVVISLFFVCPLTNGVLKDLSSLFSLSHLTADNTIHFHFVSPQSTRVVSQAAYQWTLT